MDERCLGLVVYLKEPYPPVAVQEPNPVYARAMQDNVGGIRSEMSLSALYTYNHIMTWQNPEVSRVFYDLGGVESHHLEIFSGLTRQLGGDPRLWAQVGTKKVYWSPKDNRYPLELGSLLENAIIQENSLIEKYRQQLEVIGDPLIQANLLRVIADEEHHVVLLAHLYDLYAF